MSPLHALPPLEGGGLEQVRSLTLVPPPHVTLHEVQVLHGVNPPSTTINKEESDNFCTNNTVVTECERLIAYKYNYFTETSKDITNLLSTPTQVGTGQMKTSFLVLR